MRIIGGALGGRRLRAPRGDATRPTADRVRESLFNILGDVEGARVLDLYAGTGALGLESLSRGAALAVCVDKGAEPARVIVENATTLGVADRVRVVRADVGAALARLAGERFDLVFLDPPYSSGGAGETDRVLTALPPLVAPGGRVIVEHDRRRPPGEIVGLSLTDRRRYGDTEVSFYSP